MANEQTRRFPASHRVAQALPERLAGGYYLSGSWLPAEQRLAAEFGVSRPLVRAAVARLVAEGLLVRRAGWRPGCRHHAGPPWAGKEVGARASSFRIR
ncbi:MAG: GntR family transcriptional regulator [Chthonomonadales bacterium]|nr:GntR family transcriptional regulator [Chthonomonadales bacterium]